MEAQALALWKKHADALPPLAGYPISVRRFSCGESLAAVGDPLAQLCFVVEGCAMVYHLTESGRVSLVCEYRGVQTLGELELLMDYPTYSSDVRALTDGAMLRIPLEAARAQIFSDAAMLRFLGREVARKLERTSRLATQDRLYSIAQRLAAYLLHTQRGGRVRIHLTRLSELMGTSYRHLLRTLQQFCAQGYLARDPEGYRVLNPEALARLGQGVSYE